MSSAAELLFIYSIVCGSCRELKSRIGNKVLDNFHAFSHLGLHCFMDGLVLGIQVLTVGLIYDTKHTGNTYCFMPSCNSDQTINLLFLVLCTKSTQVDHLELKFVDWV